MQRRIVTTTRDCPARLVPTGDPITVPGGSFVTLTQSLGGTFTIVINGNMARIAGADADALGMPPEVLHFPDIDETSNNVDPEHVWFALRTVYDPEIPVNIADLGLIYDVEVQDNRVHIEMTLTAPGCGMGPVLVEEVRDRVRLAPNVADVDVELVFDPPWSRAMMSEEAQLELGLFS